MHQEAISINTEYITLGQLLKLVDVIQSGGMAKWYLSEFVVYVNEAEEDRRGRKLYPGDIIELPNEAMTLQIQYSED